MSTLTITETESGTFEVIGDLREITDMPDRSTNHTVTAILEHEMVGVRSLKGVEMDSEYSCFYGYAPTRKLAEKLRLRAEAVARGIVIERPDLPMEEALGHLLAHFGPVVHNRTLTGNSASLSFNIRGENFTISLVRDL